MFRSSDIHKHIVGFSENIRSNIVVLSLYEVSKIILVSKHYYLPACYITSNSMELTNYKEQGQSSEANSLSANHEIFLL
jgi:hypothetical protein